MPERPRWYKRIKPVRFLQRKWSERKARKRDKPEKPSKPRTYKPIHLATLLVLAVVALVITAVAALFMLNAAQVPAGLANSPDLAVRIAQLRVDVIRNILAVGAGAGGLIALFVALRRQYVKERVDYADQEYKNMIAVDTKHDAAEKRLTELYVKAAEQLGSEKAPVRMAALYALQRLGQDNPDHRQTVMNLICSYLRMPFTPPKPTPEGDEIPEFDDDELKRRHELEVRTTAQRIIATHLHYDSVAGDGDELEPLGKPQFWRLMDVDLTNAVLVDFDFSRCSPRILDLARARLIGPSNFAGMFAEVAALCSGAQFDGNASFYAVRVGIFSCPGAKFRGGASFRGARFILRASFDNVAFGGEVDFREISGDPPELRGATAPLSGIYEHDWPDGYALKRNRYSADIGDLIRVGSELKDADPEQRYKLRFPPPPAGSLPVRTPRDPESDEV
ncbi:pentapeptide repeat-containing protein [Micromonospora sp. NPDC047187]|uniref:pentapeptide repeat-containing protein n=1 Tax=Micromonospora sp. NPDC047187 TaxID=3155262 RepID=UPI0033E44916